MASKTPDNIIEINEHLVQSQLKDVVKNTVEETLNAMFVQGNHNYPPKSRLG